VAKLEAEGKVSKGPFLAGKWVFKGTEVTIFE
jgi:hypothetical protein